MGPYGPQELTEWMDQGVSPTIRATVLRRLLVDDDGWPVHARGVQLNGITISGRLDLEGATLRCPLRLEDCDLDQSGEINLRYATVSLLVLKACRLGGLTGDSLVVTKELDLAESIFTGPVRLPDADITGQLTCRGTQLTGADDNGNALIAERMRVRGRIFLGGGFTSNGTVRLASADISGQLSCRDARLEGAHEAQSIAADGIKIGGALFLDGKEFVSFGTISLRSADIGGMLSCGGARLEGTHAGESLSADGIKIGGDLFLSPEVRSAAAIRLLGAKITGELNCRGATLAYAEASDAALIADGVKVGGDVFLDQGFTPYGAVRLSGADITGQLTMRGAQLIRRDRDGVALLADRMKVGGDVFLGRYNQVDFLSKGMLFLKQARVGGSLSFTGAKLDVPEGKPAMVADGLQITGTLHWQPSKPVSGRVSLKGARTAELDDAWKDGDKDRDNAFWPKDLQLEDFSYATISADNKATVKQRLDWIRGGRKGRTWFRSRRVDGAGTAAVFASGPYQQLFELYQRTGNDTDARRVAIVQRRDQRKFGQLRWYRRLFNQLLDYSIGFGYRTWEALVALVLLYVAVLLFTMIAVHHNGAFVPVPQNALGIQPVPSALSCQQDYPCFNPYGYAFDTVVPIINLHEAEFWRPNEATGWGLFSEWISWFAIVAGGFWPRSPSPGTRDSPVALTTLERGSRGELGGSELDRDVDHAPIRHARRHAPGPAPASRANDAWLSASTSVLSRRTAADGAGAGPGSGPCRPRGPASRRPR